MTLKQKSLLISLSTTIAFLLIVIAVVYQIIAVQFQKIENQRVERNIRRVSAVLEDRYIQISSKLTDWTNWDDTYKFIQDKNKAYVSSNLIPESFRNIGVDEALFIDKNGGLVSSILSIPDDYVETDFPEDIYSKFSTGSALLKIDSNIGYNKGIIRTDYGILLFAVREILKSDQSGPPMGYLVFARYLDKTVLNSVKELTQFEAIMYFWDDPNLPSDFLPTKEDYRNGSKEHISNLSKDIISGYLVIEDIYGQPQAIVRSDIARDITLQGKSSMFLLMYLLASAGVLSAFINLWLLTGGVLRKISIIAKDVDSLAKSGIPDSRLKIGATSDEVDKLRDEINEMVDSLQKNKTELLVEKQVGVSITDLIDAIIVTLDDQGKVLTINKKGLDTLGYKNEEVIGKEWITTFVSPKHQDMINKTFNSFISEKFQDDSQIENEIVTKDGKVLSISWRNNIIKNDQGKVISIVSLGEDITDKKEDLKKKEDYAKQLEEMNKIMVGRELKMIELKNQISKLSKK